MENKNGAENKDNRISRRKMLGYCLASAAGAALWRFRGRSGGEDAGNGTDSFAGGEDADSLTERLKEELFGQGADLVGIGDLTALPERSRSRLPVGICVAVKFPKEVVSGIVDMPTREYYDSYNELNSSLYTITSYAVKKLKEWGYQATTQVNLPHKTVATRAGVGWVGKSNLLVTESYGSMIRLGSILTDAPLLTAEPVNESKCGDCMLCVDACPAAALTGKLWDTTVERDEILNTSKCSAMAVERSIAGVGIPIELCGKCFAVCKYTRQYIEGGEA